MAQPEDRMASPKKSVHLPDEVETSPRVQESQSLVSSSVGNFSRLVRDISPDVITMWRGAEAGLRGELVADEPSTSAPTQPKPQSKLRQHTLQPGRKQLRSQPELGSPGRQGPSNFSRLPEIPQKHRSLPASPASSSRPPRHHWAGLAGPLNTNQGNLNGCPSFIAGATVAGPLSGTGRTSLASTTAVTAAALFAISAGQTLTAASIAYTATGNGTFGPPVGGSTGGGCGGGGGGAGAGGGSGAGGTPVSAAAAPTPLSPPPPSAVAAGGGSGGSMQSQITGCVRGGSNGGDGSGLTSAEDDFGGGSSGGGGGGGGGSDPAATLLPTDKLRLLEDERLRNRLVSLPNIVCRSANGDVFLVDLGNVQSMLHKRELGEEGLAILNRLTPALAHAIGSGGSGGDGAHCRRRRSVRIAVTSPRYRRPGFLRGADGGGGSGGDDGGGPGGSPGGGGVAAITAGLHRTASQAPGRNRNGGIAAAATAMQRGGVGSVTVVERDPLMEAQLERHIAATDDLVQRRRQQLEEDWRRRRIVAANPAAAAKEVEETRRVAAIEFAVHQFVPRRLALMALNMPPAEDDSGGGGAGLAASQYGTGGSGAAAAAAGGGGRRSAGSTPAGSPASAKISQSGEQPSPPPRPFGTDFKVQPNHWKQLQVGIDRLYEKMPFLANWTSTIKKLHRVETSGGWDGLIHGVDELYVKGREEHQGTNIYALKCHELGVTPSTQVIQQLSSAEANMSHCHLGRQGAAALRHALSANVTITHLNLQDNHLDATGLESVLAGLYSGTMAKQPRARKLLEKRIQTAAKTLASAVNTGGAGASGAASCGPPSPTLSTSAAAVLATAAAAAVRLAAPLTSPPRRSIPGDLNVRLIPITLAKEQEQRRLAEEERLRREEEEHRAQSEAAKAAAAQEALGDGPEWLRLISETAKGPGEGGHGHTHHHSTVHVAHLALPAVGRKSAAAAAAGNLQGQPHGSQRLTCAITSLDLSNNPLGINGVRALADMLDPTITPYQFLKQLQLNKCGIPEGGGRALAIALSRGNTRLAVLGLSNNSLGNATAALLGEMLALPSGLEDLDLSWNQIKAEGARALSEGVAQNNTLTRLNLSWNGLENPGVEALGSMLQHNESLISLDLTNTRMGAEACLVLAEGIRNNHMLEALILNGNSVGDDGARFLMEAVKANNSLRYLGLQGTNMSTAARGNSQAAAFNPLSPDGSYELNLEVAAERAVALQLCQMDVSAPADLMKNIKLGDKNISSCKAMHWPHSLPVSGILTCDFVTRRVSKTIGVIENNKFVALAAQFGSSSMSDREKLALVEVMAPFNYVLCSQAATLLQSFSIGNEMVVAAALLFTRCADLDDNVTALTAALGDGHSQDALQNTLGWYSYLRFSNPTGHYELALSSRVHAALAARLKDVAYSEPVDSLNWHNAIHDQYTRVTKVAPNFGPPEDWKGMVPTFGTLSFDYVSGVMTPEGAQPISHELLDEIITSDLGIALDSAGRPVPERDFEVASHQVARLRPVVSNMTFTCEQVKKLVEAFMAPPHRVEVLVICYCLIVDRSNLWVVLYAMEPLEQALALWRLGPGNLFDKSHPTGHYVLDLANPHHETVARKLVDIALANPDMPNFWNLRINGVKRSVNENRNVWGAIVAETHTPFMEFDFIGPDGWEAIGWARAEVEALGPGDRLDLRTKHARRLELSRMRAMYAYYEDGSGWSRPPWQNRQLLMRALQDKAPWQAAWDRLARVLLRAELRRGGIDGESFLEDVFYSATSGEDAMTAEQFEALTKDWGYNKFELSWVCDLFDGEARPANPKDGPAYKPYPLKPCSPPGGGGVTGDGSPPPPSGALSSPVGRSLGSRTSRQQSQVTAAASLAAAAFSSGGGGSAAAAAGSPPSGGGGGSSYDSPSPSRGSRLANQSAVQAAAATAGSGSGGGPLQQLPQPQQPQMIPNLVVDFPLFVKLFMREPPRLLRLLRPATTSSVIVDGVELLPRASRKLPLKGSGR